MKEFLKTLAATLATGCTLLLVWYLVTRPGGLPAHVLPAPQNVGKSLWFSLTQGFLAPHIAFTLKSALSGLAIAVAAAVLVGGLAVLIPTLGAFFTPLVQMTQSVPKVAIAPIIIGYLGFGIEAKIITVAVLCFFPMFVGIVNGMHSLDARLVDLYRAASASPLHVLVHARIPAAAPYFFSALQLSVALALVGSVVSEFIASSQGLGFVLKSRAEDVNLSIMFATVVVLSVLGVIGGLAVRFVQRRVVFWL